MATNDFLAAGGDTYAILAENFENSGILIGINLEDALINYIQNIDDNCAGYAEPAGRIVIVDEAPVEPTPAPAPGTGAADIIGFGIVAIICGGFVVFFRRKSYINK